METEVLIAVLEQVRFYHRGKAGVASVYGTLLEDKESRFTWQSDMCSHTRWYKAIEEAIEALEARS